MWQVDIISVDNGERQYLITDITTYDEAVAICEFYGWHYREDIGGYYREYDMEITHLIDGNVNIDKNGNQEFGFYVNERKGNYADLRT